MTKVEITTKILKMEAMLMKDKELGSNKEFTDTLVDLRLLLSNIRNTETP